MMERIDQAKQKFVDFMQQGKQVNSFPATWNSSGEACSALSKSSSSSVVMSNDGNFSYDALGHAHHSNIPCESSTQSGPVLKEHDYIGLAEVSSASSSISGDDGISDVEDTDLRLGRGPLKEDLCSTQHVSQKKALPLLKLELLEPNNSMQNAHMPLKDGSAPATASLPYKNGCKRVYRETLSEKIPGVKVASTIIAPFKPPQEPNLHAHQNLYLSNWPAPNSNAHYSSTDTKELQTYEAASVQPPPAKDQVVGWPPVRSYRRNTLTVTHPHPAQNVDGYSAMYVKANMDGVPIGRKVDLNAYRSYKSLLAGLEEMFYSPSSGNSAHFLTNGEFALTYEDKEEDWMLVGDVPWGMFVDTVRRLRIVQGSEAHGLAPTRSS